jgi:hypothetical protein
MFHHMINGTENDEAGSLIWKRKNEAPTPSVRRSHPVSSHRAIHGVTRTTLPGCGLTRHLRTGGIINIRRKEGMACLIRFGLELEPWLPSSPA